MALKLKAKSKREEFNPYDLLVDDIPHLLATLFAEGLQEEYFFGISFTRTGQLCVSVSDSKRNSEKEYFSNKSELEQWLNDVTGGGTGDEEPSRTDSKRRK